MMDTVAVKLFVHDWQLGKAPERLVAIQIASRVLVADPQPVIFRMTPDSLEIGIVRLNPYRPLQATYENGKALLHCQIPVHWVEDWISCLETSGQWYLLP